MQTNSQIPDLLSELETLDADPTLAETCSTDPLALDPLALIEAPAVPAEAEILIEAEMLASTETADPTSSIT